MKYAIRTIKPINHSKHGFTYIPPKRGDNPILTHIINTYGPMIPYGQYTWNEFADYLESHYKDPLVKIAAHIMRG